ncbi:hypothetical protein GYMLUDRAFT_182608, partial [Collybiopsis luxurians FD-317 M1]
STNREGCTPDTRTSILRQTHSWVADDSPSSPPIFWISGMAGTGKSTIAKTICEVYSGKYGDYQLGASFFCSRQLPELRDQRNVIPTVAFELSHRCTALQGELVTVEPKAMKKPESHVASLLLGPWKQVSETQASKWLIVLDALDELENNGGYNILKQLLEGVAGIKGLKILVTSRPDQNIANVCRRELSSKTICNLQDVEKEVALQDISKFIYAKLGHLIPKWKAELDQLAEQCDGLFIYAATAIRYICGNPDSKVQRKSQKQSDQLKSLLSKPDLLLTQNSHIGILYQRILDEVFANEGGDDAQTVVSTIMCVKQPVSMPVLATLITQPGEDLDEAWVREVINALHAMTFTQNDCVYIYHKSFLDFFPKDGITKQGMELTKSCMHVMQQGLHFNMCNLPSSYLLDSEVSGLQNEVQLRLGNELGYAVQYWIPHLIEQEANDQLFYSLAELMEKKVLFWVEAMNLMQKKEDCYRNLLNLQIWLTKNMAPLALIEAVATVDSLVKSFTQTTASLSTPHLYLSSLATEFATTPSATQWKNNFRNVPKVICTGVSNHGGEILQMQCGRAVKAVAFSPNGSKLVSGSHDATVCIWDALTGDQILQMKGHTNAVHSVDFSRDGSKVISGSDDRTVRLWNAVNGEQEMIMNGHTEKVYSVSFSSDGSKVVSGSADRTIQMWDAVTGNRLIEIVGHTSAVYSVAFSPDGTNIVSGSKDVICIWNASTGAELKQMNEQCGGVRSVGFSLDGTILVSGSAFGASIWDPVTGDQLKQLDSHINVITSVAISSDGSLVVSGSDKIVCIWDAVTGEQLKQLDGHTDWVNSVVFSPDGSKIISGSEDGTIRVWDAIIGDQPKPVDGHTGTVQSVAFSCDGSKVVSGSIDSTICIWDALTGDKLMQMFGHRSEVSSVAFSSDGSRVVSGSYEATVRIWDTATGMQLKQMHGHSGQVWSVAFPLSGSKIVSGSADQSVRIWDALTGVELKQMNGHTEHVNSVAFSSDGLKIVSGSDDKTVCIWDAISGGQLKQMDGHTKYVLSVAFSFDGAKVVSGSADYTVCVWDVATGEQLQQIKGHANWVWTVAFSSDGSKVVSGSGDTMVCIWDATTGEQLKVMDGHTDEVFSVAISLDGSKVVSSSPDQTIRIWDGNIDCALSATPSLHHTTNILSEIQNESGDGGHAQPDFGPSLISSSSSMNSLCAHWNADNQGWIKPHHSSEHRLMWLPPSLTSALVTPDCPCIISHRGHTSVQFDWDCIGENWAKCYTPTTGSSD